MGIRTRAFVLFFSLALTLTLSLGSGLPSMSQNSQPTTRQDLENQIKDLAIKHAQSGRKEPQDSEVCNVFKDNANIYGLNCKDVLDIYYPAFTAEQNRLKSDWREQLLNGLPWITAGFIFILLIFKEVLTEKATQLINTIWDWAYQQIAGIPLFLNLALGKYQHTLKDRLTYLDTPFKIKPPLEMAKVYVPLKVKEVSEEAAPASQGQLLSPSNDLDIYRAMEQYPRLMVTGVPGSGKSVLLKHIAFTYGQSKLDLPGQPIPIRLELNSLREAALDEAKFIAKLVEVLDHNSFPRAQRFVEQGLEQGTLLLLLDGLDEVPSAIRGNVVTVINQVLTKYRDCRAIITCRTAVYDHEFDLVLNRNRLEVVEFTDHQMRHFLQAWKSRMPGEKSVEQLMQTLQDRPRIKTLARNPLLLTIITYLYTETPFVLPHSRAEFYEKATNILLELRDQERNIPNRYSTVAKRQILRRLALTAQDRFDPTNPDRRSLPDTTVRTEIRQLLPDLDLTSEDTEPILQEIVDRSGLLLEIDGGERYQFAHLTLQEFFAAAALQNQGDALTTRFETDAAAWREVVKLWCGLAGNSTQLIQAIYRRDVLLAFECLADAQEVDQALANEIIARMQRDLKTAASQDEVAQAFGAVAADTKPRGQAVLTFLQEQLTTATDPEIREAAANALSRTNLPRAATMLAEQYQQVREAVAPALIRMGDVAVPALAKLAEQGKVEAIDDVCLINTPNAATALVFLLWHGNEAVASRSAWRLAALLSQSSIEAELSTMTGLPYRSNELDWIWEPFGAKRGSPLAVVTGRIAQLLVANPDLPVIRQQNARLTYFPDPRLLIPLCAVQEQPVARLTLEGQALKEMEALLTSTDSYTIFFKSERLVQKLLTPANANSTWGRLVKGIRPDLQPDLIYRLATSNRRPDRQDWLNLFRPTTFQFSQSLSYRAILGIAFAASLGAIGQMSWGIVQNPDQILNGLIAVAIVTEIVFWISLWQGIEDHFNPIIFHKLGTLGISTFFEEIHHLFMDDFLWHGVKLTKVSLSSKALAWTVAVMVAVVAVLAWISIKPSATAGVLILVLAWSGVGSIAGSIVAIRTLTLAGAIAGIGVVAVVVALAVAWMSTQTWVAVESFILALSGFQTWALTLALAVALGYCSSYGVKALDTAYEDQTKKFTSTFLLQKLLTLFALPYFCWFPITATFSLLGLHNLFLLQNANYYWGGVNPWLIAITIWLSLFGCCCVLWVVGQRRERAARNPLQGILDDYYRQYKQQSR